MAMLFSTTEQYLVLALLFVAGLLIGLALHPGGRKWKDRLRSEQSAHDQTKRAADQRVAAAEARQRDLEQELARHPVTVDPQLAHPDQKPVYISPNETVAPVTPVGPTAAAQQQSQAQSAARPAYPDDTRP